MAGNLNYEKKRRKSSEKKKTYENDCGPKAIPGGKPRSPKEIAPLCRGFNLRIPPYHLCPNGKDPAAAEPGEDRRLELREMLTEAVRKHAARRAKKKSGPPRKTRKKDSLRRLLSRRASSP